MSNTKKRGAAKKHPKAPPGTLYVVCRRDNPTNLTVFTSRVKAAEEVLGDVLNWNGSRFTDEEWKPAVDLCREGKWEEAYDWLVEEGMNYCCSPVDSHVNTNVTIQETVLDSGSYTGEWEFPTT